MFTTKDKLFADRLGYNIRGTADQSSFISRDTAQVNAGVELKPGPCPAPERDILFDRKRQSPPAFPSNKLYKLRIKHLGR